MRKRKLDITQDISLHENELDFRYVRSRGPGGQHVNKASTAVQLRFDVPNSNSLPEPVKERLLRVGRTYATQEGVIILFADSHRSQLRNKNAAIERFLDLVREAARPRRRRIQTKPSSSSVRRRLEQKKQRGNLKQGRSWRPGDE